MKKLMPLLVVLFTCLAFTEHKDAGPDKVVYLSNFVPTTSVLLEGSGADADGTVVGYLWTKISGPKGSVIASPNTASTSVNSLVVGIYVFQLQVTDNLGATGTDQVTVTVKRGKK